MSETLKKFFTGPIFEQTLFKYPSGPFLEVGCGKYPVLPELLCALGQVDCIDHSSDAIEFCRSKYNEGEYIKADITDYREPKKYAIILDGHLLHCLDSKHSYRKALENIYHSLLPGGLFFLETMIFHSAIGFELGLNFDPETYQLYKGERVSRLILPSIQIEELVKEAGFEVSFLKVSEELRMIPHDKREDSIPEDPMVLRLIASVPTSP